MRTDTAGFAMAVPVAVVLWLGIYGFMRWLSTWPLEVMVKATAGGLLLAGSWIVIKACVELDSE